MKMRLITYKRDQNSNLWQAFHLSIKTHFLPQRTQVKHVKREKSRKSREKVAKNPSLQTPEMKLRTIAKFLEA